MAETRRKFDREFREGAVRIVRETCKPIAQVARVWGSTRAPWATGSTRTGPLTARQQRRADLADAIRKIFDASGGTYGSPRVTLGLHAAGWQVGENTVAKLMAELGLAGRAPKRRRNLTRPGKRPTAPDRVARKFTAAAPDLLWCGDMTEIVTDEVKLYLATVIDLFSRRLLGYAMSAHHDADLVEASLHMAAATRGDTIDRGDLPLGPGQRIHERDLRQGVPAAGRAAVDGPGRLRPR